ncbi:MAG: superinfection immunity protein [Pseudomonadota bacterium]
MQQWDQNALISDSGAWWLILIILVLYGLPSLVAVLRNHPATKGIVLLNILGGWTGLAWIAALVWSFMNAERPFWKK